MNKKSWHVLIAALLATMISCKKNDDSSTATLVGSWEATRLTQKITDLSTTPPSMLVNTDTSFAGGTGYYIEYRANNTYLEKLSPATSKVFDSGTYVLFANNTKIATVSKKLSQSDTNGYAISGNMLTISHNDTVKGYHEEYSITYKRQ